MPDSRTEHVDARPDNGPNEVRQKVEKTKDGLAIRNVLLWQNEMYGSDQRHRMQQRSVF